MRSSRRRLSASVAVLLVFAAVAAPSALAKPEEVAYQCDGDICLADPDTFNSVVNLTDNGYVSLDKDPVWSPNGKKVAFVGTNPKDEADRTQNIYVMEPGKGEASNIATQLTFYEGNVFGNDIESIAWSPDGTRIAFSRSPNYGAHDGVFEVASDGTTLAPLPLAADGYHPSWSPDGGKLVYATYSQLLYTVNSGGSGTQQMPGVEHAVEPTWSPDGLQIAYGQVTYVSSFLDLQIVAAPGSGASPVTVPIPYPEEPTQWIDAVWSPDGGRTTYRSTFENGSYGYIHAVGRFGGASTPLPKVQGVNMGQGSAPTWSPDGHRLAFEGYSPETGHDEIYVGNADGSGSVGSITLGTRDREPSWRPDPLVTPYVPVIQPSGGSVGSTGPSGQRKPKLVWFTKRAPIVASAPVHMMAVFCGAPDCGASVIGTSKASRAAGLPFRLAEISKKKPRRIVIGKGKLRLKEGKQKTLDMYLTKDGRALLEKQGKLTIEATVKVTSTGQPTVTSKKTIQVVLAKAKKGS